MSLNGVEDPYFRLKEGESYADNLLERRKFRPPITLERLKYDDRYEHEKKQFDESVTHSIKYIEKDIIAPAIAEAKNAHTSEGTIVLLSTRVYWSVRNDKMVVRTLEYSLFGYGYILKSKDDKYFDAKELVRDEVLNRFSSIPSIKAYASKRYLCQCRSFKFGESSYISFSFPFQKEVVDLQ